MGISSVNHPLNNQLSNAYAGGYITSTMGGAQAFTTGTQSYISNNQLMDRLAHIEEMLERLLKKEIAMDKLKQ